MSLFISESARHTHPVDIIEQLASHNEWAFDRAADDEISITVSGGWTDYQISFTWLEDVESLHLACAFEFNCRDRRRNELLRLVSMINEQLWIGHFGLWETENMVLFRHALLLSGGLQPTPAQCEALLNAAITSCERYYQSFQFVLWSGKTAPEALEGALFETAGEA